MDNNAAERALRGVALGRGNYLFMGSDAGGERAAAIYSLVQTAKLNGIDPEAYLREVPSVLPSTPSIASKNRCPGTRWRSIPACGTTAGGMSAPAIDARVLEAPQQASSLELYPAQHGHRTPAG